MYSNPVKKCFFLFQEWVVRTEMLGASWPGQFGLMAEMTSILKSCNMCTYRHCFYSCLWCISGVIYKCTQTWDLGSVSGSRTSQAKQVAMGRMWRLLQMPQLQEKMGSQSIMGTGPGRTIHISTANVIATQVCYVTYVWHFGQKNSCIMFNIIWACMQETNSSYFPRRLKINHISSWKLFLHSGERYGCKQWINATAKHADIFQRWAYLILVRTSAIPQYCGQIYWLQNCGLEKVGELQLQTFKIWLPQFCNSPHSPASFATFLSLFLCSGWFQKSPKNNFRIVCFYRNQKLALKGLSSEIDLAGNGINR